MSSVTGMEEEGMWSQCTWNNNSSLRRCTHSTTQIELKKERILNECYKSMFVRGFKIQNQHKMKRNIKGYRLNDKDEFVRCFKIQYKHLKYKEKKTGHKRNVTENSPVVVAKSKSPARRSFHLTVWPFSVQIFEFLFGKLLHK